VPFAAGDHGGAHDVQVIGGGHAGVGLAFALPATHGDGMLAQGERQFERPTFAPDLPA
jgi:hypothetical protein